jgi:hypothetical protein
MGKGFPSPQPGLPVFRKKNNTGAKAGVKVEGYFPVLFSELPIPPESEESFSWHGTRMRAGCHRR